MAYLGCAAGAAGAVGTLRLESRACHLAAPVSPAQAAKAGVCLLVLRLARRPRLDLQQRRCGEWTSVRGKGPALPTRQAEAGCMTEGRRQACMAHLGGPGTRWRAQSSLQRACGDQQSVEECTWRQREVAGPSD